MLLVGKRVSSLKQANLLDATIDGASFSRANLQGAQLPKLGLNHVNFCQATMPDDKINTTYPRPSSTP